MAARNEAWLIGLSLRAALRWCDEAVVLLHACTDRTGDIVSEVQREHPGRVRVMVEHDPNWREMDHRQRMLIEARKHGATHIANVDADEILTGHLVPVIREHLERLPSAGYMRMAMFCVWRDLFQFRDDTSVFGRACTSMLAFADDPRVHWEAKNGYDHHHREPHGSRQAAGVSRDSGGIMHLQWLDWRRLVAKQTWYQCMERLKYPDKPVSKIAEMYSYSMNESGMNLVPTPDHWWDEYRDILHHVDLSVRPWQEAEVDRMIAEHGREKFAGLNLQYQTREAVPA